MDEQWLNREDAELLAALCEQVADYLRQNAGALAWESIMGVEHIIRGTPADKWADKAKRLRQTVRGG